MSRRECQRCGACCVANEWDSECYVQLLDGDMDYLTPDERRKCVVEKHYAVYLKTRHRKEATVCAFLRGPLMGRKPCRCAINERKPKACRGFEPGSSECRAARREIESVREERLRA